jgi:hypothetical protein
LSINGHQSKTKLRYQKSFIQYTFIACWWSVLSIPLILFHSVTYNSCICITYLVKEQFTQNIKKQQNKCTNINVFKSLQISNKQTKTHKKPEAPLSLNLSIVVTWESFTKWPLYTGDLYMKGFDYSTKYSTVVVNKH